MTFIKCPYCWCHHEEKKKHTCDPLMKRLVAKFNRQRGIDPDKSESSKIKSARGRERI